MSVYQMGSTGEEVKRIQQRLKTLDIYRGPIDGIFGGGTDTAVRVFQGKEGLDVDGQVGPLTWRALFAKEVPWHWFFNVQTSIEPNYKAIRREGEWILQ